MGNGMDPTYFKQTLTPYEAEAYLNGIEQRGRAAWEQTRMTAYCSLAPWSKDLKPTDVMQFAWDGNTKTEVTREVINDLMNWGANALEMIKKQKHGQE